MNQKQIIYNIDTEGSNTEKCGATTCEVLADDCTSELTGDEKTSVFT